MAWAPLHNICSRVQRYCIRLARQSSSEGWRVKRLSGDQSVSSMTLVHALWRPDIDAVTPSAGDRWFCVTRAINASLTADWSDWALAPRKRSTSTWFIHQGEAKGNSSEFLSYFQLLYCAKKHICLLVNGRGLKTDCSSLHVPKRPKAISARANTGKEHDCRNVNAGYNGMCSVSWIVNSVSHLLFDLYSSAEQYCFSGLRRVFSLFLLILYLFQCLIFIFRTSDVKKLSIKDNHSDLSEGTLLNPTLHTTLSRCLLSKVKFPDQRIWRTKTGQQHWTQLLTHIWPHSTFG